MQCVIVNEKGRLYAGFSSETSKPVWCVGKRAECIMDEGIADQVVSQLRQLGFQKVAKRRADEVARKWVPADLDASAI